MIILNVSFEGGNSILLSKMLKVNVKVKKHTQCLH